MSRRVEAPLGASTRRLFFWRCETVDTARMHVMKNLNETMAQQVARAAAAHEQRRTGNPPNSVTVVLSGETLVITLHGVLSPAEKALAKTVAGAATASGISSPTVHQLLRAVAARDQTNHRRRCPRGHRRSRIDDRHRRAGLHHRHHGASVPARPRRRERSLEREST